MEKNPDDIDDIQRWFYGGAPPAGDADDTPLPAALQQACDCRCASTAHALINRLRAAAPTPVR